MNRPLASTLFILLLVTIIGFESYKIYQDFTTPQARSFDDKIETPQPLPSEEVSPNPLNTDNSEQRIKPKTKPRPESKFLKVSDNQSEQFRYSKEEYLSKIKTKKSSSPNLAANWEKKILNPETDLEKTLIKASKQAQNYEGQIPTTPSAAPKDMERYAIKIELPEMNEGTKFTLQYREPPDFGRSQIPEAALQIQKPATSASGFTIEKTKAYDSPWDNFSGSKSNP